MNVLHALTDEEILQHVRSIIADVLRISVEGVSPDSVLGAELGAESMDFVDLQFRLESDFNITLYQGSAVDRLAEVFGPGVLSHDGRLSELGVAVLRRRMSEVEPAKIFGGMSLGDIESLFTVASWARVVHELLDARPHACSGCKSENLTPVRPSVLVCETCGTELGCPTQEDLLVAWATDIAKSLGNAAR